MLITLPVLPEPDGAAYPTASGAAGAARPADALQAAETGGGEGRGGTIQEAGNELSSLC